MTPTDHLRTTRAVDPPISPTTTINATGQPSSSATRSLLPRGATIGRYVVLDKIGVGGMGVVYSAYDPELDRKLAIKLLSATEDVSSIRRRRLLREGQAMAKLSHPNVITVHDVGTVGEADEQVFVAMEFIDGGTLRGWLKPSRTWAEIVEMFIAAGKGLWAAHEAGLVHRDFKPDNVMVAADGRVVVMDFGLARSSAAEGGLSSADSAAALRKPSEPPTGLEATVTAAGAVMGTPAYMSPEQHEGRATDARSDQFAFCVAMYEALFEQRPFRGRELTALAVNVCCGNLVEPPASSQVPTWLKTAVIKGLAVDPGDRHADMRALLDELSADRSALSQRLLPWLGVAAVAGGGLAAGLWIEGGAGPCEQADGRLAGTWDAARADAVHAAFTATGLAFAEDTWPAVRAALDQYTQALSQGYIQACEATHVRNEQSAVAFDRRVSCLAGAQGELTALLALLADGDPVVVENALSAAQGLPKLEVCADPRHLADGAAAPDAAIAARVEALTPQLSQVTAMRHAGLFDEGLALAEALRDQTRELGYAPLHARAMLQLAAFQDHHGQALAAERSIREALSEALRSKTDDVATEAAVELVAVVGRVDARHDEAEAWAELAAALLGRSGADPDTEARLLAFRASILRREGRLAEAAEALQRALAQTERAHGPSDPRVADASAELADVVGALGERHRARQLYERALAIDERSLGRDHPSSATILHALGDLSVATGEFGPAIAYHKRGLAIREAVFGAQGVELTDSLRALGMAYAVLGRADAADEHLARAASVAEGQLGRNHPVTIGALVDHAAALSGAGRIDDAIARLIDARARLQAGPPTTASAARGRLVEAMGPRVHEAPTEASIAAALAAAYEVRAAKAPPPTPPSDGSGGSSPEPG